MTNIWESALAVLAGSSAAVLLIATLARPFLEGWLRARIDAGVREQTERRLREHQLGLDKDLERHKGSLAVEVEMLRGELARAGIDFRLYAQRRHDAIAKLYEAFREAATLATDYSGIPSLGSRRLSEPELDRMIERYLGSAETAEAREARRLWLAGVQDELHKLFERAAESQILDRVTKAYNEAQRAYFAAAIYLPDTVDAAAIAVRDHFNAVALPHLIGGDGMRGEIQAAHVRLRFLMLELQNAARAELARSTRPTPVYSPSTGTAGGAA